MRTETDYKLAVTRELFGGEEKGLHMIVVVVTQLYIFTKKLLNL